MFLCQDFKKLNVNERRDFVAKHKLCFKCVSSQHIAVKCKAKNC
jgi:hypothetical protein